MFLMVFVAISFLSATCFCITVNKSDELESILCHHFPTHSDLLLELSTDITHLLNEELFCVVNTNYSLTITSDSSTLATIQCVNGSSSTTQPNGGFAFINLHKLTLQRLLFIDCGAYLAGLNKRILEIINSTSSPVYFTQYQSAVLLFVHIKTTLINEVSIISYYGFGVVAINSLVTVLDTFMINSSKSVEFFPKSLGSGVLLLFVDSVLPSANVSIRNANVTHNIEYTNYSIELQHLNDSVPITNAAGLTIVYTQKLFVVDVLVTSCTFIKNMGGGMFVLYFNANTKSKVTVDNCIFVKNQPGHYGAGISMFVLQTKDTALHNNGSFNPLTVSNSQFIHQKPWYFISEIYLAISGAVHIIVYNPPQNMMTITFSNDTFTNNSAIKTGSSLYAKVYSLKRPKTVCIVMDGVSAFHNTQMGMSSLISKAGVFTLVNLKTVVITGLNNVFYKNHGSVFEVINSDITLSGNMCFRENSGERGSAFKVYGDGMFYFQNGLRASFINNTALTKGGAIYVYGRNNGVTNQCKFQSDVGSHHNISKLNVSILFINNSAVESGNSIFSTHIYNCYVNKHHFNHHESRVYYRTISNGTLENGLSTLPIKRCVCYMGNCIGHNEQRIDAYPGQKIHVPLAAVDPQDKITYTDVSLTLAYEVYIHGFYTLYNLPSWYISSNDISQVLLESQCTTVNATLMSKGGTFKFTKTLLVVSSVYDSSILKVKLKLFDCPLGFTLNTGNGKCECSQIINQLGLLGEYNPICKIHSDITVNGSPLITITRPSDSTAWLGLVNTSNAANISIGVALTCHMYCTVNPRHRLFVINGTNIGTIHKEHISNIIPICMPNREGPLCSTCAVVNGLKYSVVFGSKECQYCSNWWLLTLVLYALAGPLLIYLLFALKLTLTTGTINGVVFYAQMYGIIKGVRHTKSSHNFGAIYFDVTDSAITFINLNLGVSLCFYNGMTELWKTGISLLFSVYLLIIVVILIILCRYSVWLSNKISHSSVQVLVTVVHLSFSRLLTTTMDVFTPINIYLNTTDTPLKVWYSDATIEYGKHGHLILMVITASIVGPILITYLTILIAGRPLQKIHPKIREYIRPIYEAIHAPYKRNKEFFFAARVVLAVFYYLLYSMYRGNDRYQGLVIALVTLICYSMLETLSRPFRKLWLNCLSTLLLTNILFILSTIWYFYKTLRLRGLIFVLEMNTSFVIGTLVAIIIGHILWVTGMLKVLQDKVVKLYTKYFAHRLPVSAHQCDNLFFTDSIFKPYNEVREPLLSP